MQAGKVAFQKDRSDGLLLPSSLADIVLAKLELLFEHLVRGEDAAALHQTTLAEFRANWLDIQSSQTCLTCLMRRPQYTLTCGHALCENCVQTFGNSEDGDPYLFAVDTCTLCGASVSLVVRVRPPTAGQGILCIDGGGVRGVIPATLLELIQERLDLPIPVQEHFSLAYGISAGELLVNPIP